MIKAMMRSKITATVAVIMAVWLIFPGIAAAQEVIKKDEDIYVSLANDGTFLNAYVINSFSLDAPSTVEDYGDYDKVVNLTTSDELVVEDGKVTVNAPAGKFYYQGNISTVELPWDIDILYELDGKEISHHALAGAEGALRINISIKPNQKAMGDFDKHYAVQTTLVLDSELCTDIKADGATMVNVGKNKTISFNLLPGSEGVYTVLADVKDFRMDSIQFAGVPLSISLEGINKDSVTGKLSGLTDLAKGAEDIDKGAQQLKNGAADLVDGTASLRNGMKQWHTGLEQLNNGFDGLTSQNSSILQGTAEFAEGLSMLKQMVPEDMLMLRGTIEQLIQGFGQLNGGINAYVAGAEEISRNYKGLSENYEGLVKASEYLYSGTSELYKGTEQLADGTGKLRKGTAGIEDEIEKSIDELLSDYTGGDFEAVSFIAPQNNNVEAVQFVMQTDPIEKDPIEAEEKAPEEKNTFWKRILALFNKLQLW